MFVLHVCYKDFFRQSIHNLQMCRSNWSFFLLMIPWTCETVAGTVIICPFQTCKTLVFPNSAIHIEYIVLLNQFSRTSAIVYMTLVAIFYSYIIVLPRPNPILPGWLWFPKTHPKTNGFGLKISKMTIRRGDSPDDGIQLVTSCAPIYSKYSWWMLFSYELQPKFTVMESSIRHIFLKKIELGLGKR